jgi:ABC-2 type transport system ATP-binding protein
MIEVSHLTKRFGPVVAVDDLSFDVRPGQVTGFLGPNGAGKTTTMLTVLGLERADQGEARISGRRYHDLPSPLREVGALLDAKAVHGGRRAYDHLLYLAQSNRIPTKRIHDVLTLVGLGEVGRRRVKGFSLGMCQRLGIAAALLGDPPVLMFDEPLNGLDPEGIVWMRTLMRELAAEGRTVLFSSHLISEVSLAADHLVVIGRGRLIADMTVKEFVRRGSEHPVLVRTPRAADLTDRLCSAGVTVSPAGDGAIRVTGMDAPAIGDLAAADRIPVHELITEHPSLEEAFMELTRDSVEFHAHGAHAVAHPAGEDK